MTANALEYATKALTRHKIALTRPPFAELADETGLPVHQLEQLWERLLAGKKPTTPVSAAPLRVVPPAPERWRQANGHPNKRLAVLHNQITASIIQLEAALDEDASLAKLRDREAELVDELTNIRAKLRNGKHTCDVCAQAFTSQGLLIHKARKHGGTA